MWGDQVLERRDRGEAVVIAPVDVSPGSAAVLPVARGLAEIKGATLHILLFGPRDTPVSRLAEELGLRPDDLRDAVVDLGIGDFADTCLELARRWRDPTIVLTLSPHPDGVHYTLAPEVAEILVHAPGPVVLVPPDLVAEPWILDGILVPHDGTPTTTAAIGPALDLAASVRANLVIVHVAEPGAGRPLEPGTMTTPRYIDQPQHEWPAWAQEFADRLCALTAWGLEPLYPVLTTGDPGPEIARFAREEGIDLVLIGWHGTLEGSRAAVLKTVIRNAAVPLLLLRARG